ncbi:MAG: CBS domain-containing protein [Thermomicrobiales bacterium]
MTTSRTLGQEFLALYTTMEEFLSKQAGPNPPDSWSAMVEEVSPRNTTVKRYAYSLKAFGRLRNAILHNPRYPDRFIAEPLADAVEEFRQISNIVISPPRLGDEPNLELQPFKRSCSLKKALEHMGENEFSQIIVRDEDGLGLITSEDIARWLENQIEGTDILVLDARLEDLRPYELPGSFQVMGVTKTLFDAEAAFHRPPRSDESRLFAIIVTNNGKRTGKPVRIVTPWDVLALD